MCSVTQTGPCGGDCGLPSEGSDALSVSVRQARLAYRATGIAVMLRRRGVGPSGRLAVGFAKKQYSGRKRFRHSSPGQVRGLKLKRWLLCANHWRCSVRFFSLQELQEMPAGRMVGFQAFRRPLTEDEKLPVPGSPHQLFTTPVVCLRGNPEAIPGRGRTRRPLSSAHSYPASMEPPDDCARQLPPRTSGSCARRGRVFLGVRKHVSGWQTAPEYGRDS